MRTCAVAFAALLLLLLLATRAHGIRLDRQLHEAISSKETGGPKSGAAGEASIADSATTKHCTPDGHCSGNKKVKRALAHAEAVGVKPQQQSSNSPTGNDDRSSTTTVDAEEAAQQRVRHEAEATSGHASQSQSQSQSQDDDASARQTTYPDMMDIAGMDYSPATRKPPIHN